MTFGVRRQSAAATPLWITLCSTLRTKAASPLRSAAALQRTPPPPLSRSAVPRILRASRISGNFERLVISRAKQLSLLTHEERQSSRLRIRKFSVKAGWPAGQRARKRLWTRKYLKRREKMANFRVGKATTRAKRCITPAFEGYPRSPRTNYPCGGVPRGRVSLG